MHVSIKTVKGKSINLEVEDSPETIDLKIHVPTRQMILRIGPDPGPDAAMRISASTLNGKTFNLEVNGSMTIQKVKNMIHDQGGPPVDEQRLFFQERELHNYRTVADCNIETDSDLAVFTVQCGC